MCHQFLPNLGNLLNRNDEWAVKEYDVMPYMYATTQFLTDSTNNFTCSLVLLHVAFLTSIKSLWAIDWYCSMTFLPPLEMAPTSPLLLRATLYVLKCNIVRCFYNLKLNILTRNCIRSLCSQDLCNWYHTNCRLVMCSSKSY